MATKIPAKMVDGVYTKEETDTSISTVVGPINTELAKKVESVNGVLPDENLNIAIPTVDPEDFYNKTEIDTELESKQEDLGISTGATVQNPFTYADDAAVNLDTFYSEDYLGWHRFSYTANSQNGSNFPEEIAGTLLCFTDAVEPASSGDSLGVTQIYYSYNSANVWRRSLYGDNWTEWKNIGVTQPAVNSDIADSGFGGFRYTVTESNGTTTLNLFTS